ncbi:CCR4-NOT transcription complex subunit 4 isoform X2 [Nilaparvata lugens]|uniref:CCR4-NOT transcription complex subunit 4 isoform X2 n=1 Tax=Nilaparvata lugens TaxID=108931 RepID=UPI000B997202|nr:CCR4-NOT transcription complex subunit 4 isoform X2 [Nilaparvata lugens]
MSVLNQSGEEQVECPLCMEPLEVDDLNFYPCTCGYQICRFCWHRIRTDENGLCPACRKAYPEDPADFKPLSQEEVARLKAEKRLKDQQRKQKITENRKHLANVRVVQRNLVFVVGLPVRLADAETLKKHDYFGKYGKIHKVVINQSTSYAGSQGPSASAYVTYQKPDDALRAIQAVNSIVVDGRTIKTSLGTTKYCSHFMKNQSCPKGDCMYLHDFGDPEASFTKEEMQQGKHQEYEKKLHDQLINSTCTNTATTTTTLNRKPTPSPPAVAIPTSAPVNIPNSAQPHAQAQSVNKEAWPSLQTGLTPPNSDSAPMSVPIQTTHPASQSYPSPPNIQHNTNNNKNETRKNNSNTSKSHKKRPPASEDRKPKENHTTHCSDQSQPLWEQEIECKDSVLLQTSTVSHVPPAETLSGQRSRAANLFEQDNNSFFSSNTFSKINNCTSGTVTDWSVNGVTNNMPDVLPPVHSSEDWQAAFGFPAVQQQSEEMCGRDDDLGFDPFHETQKALAEMIEKEEQTHHRMYQQKLLTTMQHNQRITNCSKLLDGLRVAPRTRLPPPGFTSTPNHMNAFGLGIPRTGTKVLPFMQPTISFPQHSAPPAWDWSALDPAIVSTGQHCEMYTSPPPPGFAIRQTLDNL